MNSSRVKDVISTFLALLFALLCNPNDIIQLSKSFQ
jgi:hypothetical protein